MALSRVHIGLIVGLVTAGVLALGLGLGLGLRGRGGSEPESQGCATFPATSDHTKATQGERWRSTQCPNPGRPTCPKGLNPPTILVSLDGFRADYLLRNMTPNLQKMVDCGVHAPYMRSVYPTKTFPNQYTIVTGLYPESHGIIDNTMFDMDMMKIFRLGSSEVTNKEWWRGEPIWNTVKKEGGKSNIIFWPGSEAPIQDMRPDVCYTFDGSVTYTSRVRQMLSFFDGDSDNFPSFSTLYLEQPDKAGHNDGPFGDWVNGNLTVADNVLGMLMDGLVERGLDNCVNLVVVADHGMAPLKCRGSHIIDLAEIENTNNYYIYGGPNGRMTSKYVSRPDGPIKSDNPEPAESMMQKYQCINYDTNKDWYVRLFQKEHFPKRHHYANNHRIEEIVLDVEEKFLLEGSYKTTCLKGTHGYDNTYSSMHAIFVAQGPSFKRGLEVESFENIELYNLFADLLDIHARVRNNGTVGRLHHLLANPPISPTLPPPFSSYSGCGFPGNKEDRETRRAASDCECSNLRNLTNKDLETVDQQLNLNPSQKEASRSANLPFGVPELGWRGADVCELTHTDYVSGYSHDAHMPVWSAYNVKKVTGKSVIDQTYRYDDHELSCVRPDVRLTEEQQVQCSHYQDSNQGISHNFLYPPGFSVESDNSLDAHISSNIVPMYEGFRDGVWREAMILLEDYSGKYGDLNVVAGPLFDYNFDGLRDDLTKEDGVQYVGDGPVPIPTHYYLIVTRDTTQAERESGVTSDKQVISLILPHRPSIDNCMDRRLFEYLKDNAARMRDVSLLAGLTLLPDVTQTQERLSMLTYLPEKLWERMGWLDLAEDFCPDLSTKQCPAGYDADNPPVVLISIDGYRPDYIDLKLSPVLERIGQCGVSSPYMKSIYPTLTFPNHYTQVTGLYPESSGIIDNSMYDVNIGQPFFLGSPNTFNTDWWGGEPIWNTLVKNNKTSMTMFWPGSDVEIQGLRPTDFYKYNGDFPYHLRVSKTLEWLTGESGPKADFVSLYFDSVDSAGHDGGPGSLQVKEALTYVDTQIRSLMDGIYKRGLLNCVNVIVVSDHGMSEISCDRVTVLADYLPGDVLENTYTYQGAVGRVATQYRRVGREYININPDDQESQDEIVENYMCKTPNMAVYKKEDLPIRNHYTSHPRIESVILKSVDTYQVSTDSPWCDIIGQHGWDPLKLTMKAYFSAYGPSFKDNYTTEPFDNVELYNLLSHLTGVDPAPNNGTEGSLYDVLRDLPDLPPSEADGDYLTCSYPTTDAEYDIRADLLRSGCQCDLDKDTIKRFDGQLNQNDPEKAQLEERHIPHGVPGLLNITDICILHHTDYVTGYSSIIKQPLWTAYTINKDQGAGGNNQNCLRPDVRVEVDQQPTCQDYNTGANQNITSGSLFPTAFATTQDSKMDTLILSNSAPMYQGFYSGIWKGLLDSLREWLQDHNQLHIITGPVFDHNRDGVRDENHHKFVGTSDIPVPSHFYFVAVKCNTGSCHTSGDYHMQAFVLQNRQNITNCMTTDDYLHDNLVRVRDVELLTGLELITKSGTQLALKRKTFTPLEIWDTPSS